MDLIQRTLKLDGLTFLCVGKNITLILPTHSLHKINTVFNETSNYNDGFAISSRLRAMRVNGGVGIVMRLALKSSHVNSEL